MTGSEIAFVLVGCAVVLFWLYMAFAPEKVAEKKTAQPTPSDFKAKMDKLDAQASRRIDFRLYHPLHHRHLCTQ